VRRDDICLYLGPADRAKLEAIVADHNSPRKWRWRAEIVLGTADGLGTNAIMRRTGKSKPCVWPVDQKSQIQALDRTQPGLPLKKGRAQTMTHDYKRNGTTTLFAALDVKTGQVIGECRARHRAKEFISFLNKIDTAVDKVLDLHLILDNYSTHKTKQVQNWLKRHKRFKLHFIPTS
jgi:transposase